MSPLFLRRSQGESGSEHQRCIKFSGQFPVSIVTKSCRLNFGRSADNHFQWPFARGGSSQHCPRLASFKWRFVSQLLQHQGEFNNSRGPARREAKAASCRRSPRCSLPRSGHGLTPFSMTPKLNEIGEPTSPAIAGRRLRVLCGSAGDPLNLLRVMPAKGATRVAATLFLPSGASER